jgi:hypothetical protein
MGLSALSGDQRDGYAAIQNHQNPMTASPKRVQFGLTAV